ncbi:MAG: DMT family transporter [Armatimonadota bacterium]
MTAVPILFAILSGLSFAFLGLSYKAADDVKCRPIAFMFVFTFTAGCISLLKTSTESTAWGDARLWWLGGMMVLTLFFGILLVMRANALGPASASWTMVNLALLVPVAMAALVLKEPLFWLDAALITLFIVMLLVLARGSATTGETKPEHLGFYLFILLLLYLSNGFFLCGYKIKEHLFGTENTGGVMVILYFGTAILALLTLLLQRGRQSIQRHEWKTGVSAGVSSVLGLYFFMLAVNTLPTLVVYPISQGIALLGGIFLTVVLYKERFNLFKSLGVALGMVVLLLAVFREPIMERLQAAPVATSTAATINR